MNQKQQPPEKSKIDTKTHSDSKSIEEKVLDWVNSEGVPTEYKAANSYRRSGCRVLQGDYIEDIEEKKMREIDVLAWQDIRRGERGILRVSHVVECKWSGSKPWVVFTSPSPIAPQACISQTYGSRFGRALLRSVAHNKRLHGMRLFSTPEEAGFSGRQAFSSGNDHFYNSLKSVTSNSLNYLNYYDRQQEHGFPAIGTIAFPVVVVEGQLFKAFFDETFQDVRLEEVSDIRCHWRGAANWNLHSTVDIVTLKSLDDFASKRAHECREFLNILLAVADGVEEAGARAT